MFSIIDVTRTLVPFEAWYDRGQSWKTAQILIASLSSKVCLPTNHTPLLTTRLYVLVCYMVLVHFVDFPCKNLCHIAKNLQNNGGSSQGPVRTQKGRSSDLQLQPARSLPCSTRKPKSTFRRSVSTCHPFPDVVPTVPS